MEPVSGRSGFDPPATPLARRLLVYFRSGAYRKLGAGPRGTVGHPAPHIRMSVSDPEHANTDTDRAEKIGFDPFSDCQFDFDYRFRGQWSLYRSTHCRS